jgi:hypothetical protein
MTKYFRYTLKGKHSPETATAALGPTAANGLIVRVNARDDETDVIMAAETAPHAAHRLSRTVRAAGEVPEAEVTAAP